MPLNPPTDTPAPSDLQSGPLPKLIGADIELGNFLLGVEQARGTAAEAARALLREFEGVAARGTVYAAYGSAGATAAYGKGYPQAGSYPHHYDGGGYSDAYPSSHATYNPQDHDRKFLRANGGCAYIDMDHLELCLPEVRDAFSHVAAWHAMLRLARDALHRANARRPERQPIQVLVNNSDGHGHSYGSHMNFLVSRACFRNLFDRKLHHLHFLASYLVSSIVFTGAGKVGAENAQPDVDYQLAQRADFLECLVGPQTTFHRPLCNSRDEAHANESRMARLHVIFFDNTLCHIATLLKAGVTQVVLAMIEQERIPLAFLFDDPVEAVLAFSHDPSLRARAPLVSGKRTTAVDAQLGVFDAACRFVATGRAEGIVPRGQVIMRLWEHVLLTLKAGDMEALAPCLDWALKLSLLQRARSQHDDLDWASPKMKHLDHAYHSLASDGLYWAMEQSGAVQRVASDAEIERFVHQPPDDTRAWLRAEVLRRARPDAIHDVDWSEIRFKVPCTTKYGWRTYAYATLSMDDPLRFTKAECAAQLSGAATLEEGLRALGLQDTDAVGRPAQATPKTSPAAAAGGPSHLPVLAQPRAGAAPGTPPPREGRS